MEWMEEDSRLYRIDNKKKISPGQWTEVRGYSECLL
jgi:hypothetical protein